MKTIPRVIVLTRDLLSTEMDINILQMSYFKMILTFLMIVVVGGGGVKYVLNIISVVSALC